jgi:hypothetical protein
VSARERRAELEALLDRLSVPRPNGSRALRRTARALRARLEADGIPCSEERFRVAAYFNELLGLWLVLSGPALLAAVLVSGGWVALGVAVLVVLVPALETGRLTPLLTRWIRVPARNLICELPAPERVREVVVAAHYDSKTEFLDHARRLWLLRRARLAMGLALAAGLASVAHAVLREGGSSWAPWALALGVASALPVAAFGVALGANLLLGRWRSPPSQGAVDNGAAVAVVVELLRRLARGDPGLRHVAVTGCLFAGEEVQMQGSRRFVEARRGRPPSAVVNLEAVGQNGGYGLWEADGTALTRVPLDPGLTASLAAAVQRVTGEEPLRLPTVNSDALPFLRAGVPAAVLSSLDRTHGLLGLHSPLDRRERVHGAKVAECVEILARWLEAEDREAAARYGEKAIPSG